MFSRKTFSLIQNTLLILPHIGKRKRGKDKCKCFLYYMNSGYFLVHKIIFWNHMLILAYGGWIWRDYVQIQFLLFFSLTPLVLIFPFYRSGQNNHALRIIWTMVLTYYLKSYAHFGNGGWIWREYYMQRHFLLFSLTPIGPYHPSLLEWSKLSCLRVIWNMGTYMNWYLHPTDWMH